MFGEQQRVGAAQRQFLSIGSAQVQVHFIHHRRARRYVLRVRRDGWCGSLFRGGGRFAFAARFAREHQAWIERQWQQRQTEALRTRAWRDGTEILFRGEPVPLHSEVSGEVQVVWFADQSLSVSAATLDLRGAVENHLWSLAEKELVPRTLQLAAEHRLRPARVVVRNQRSRWGSCSPKGTISLNWRLIQAPAWVRDYLILHELMHLHQMNHSWRFWDLVEQACPEYRSAEQWLDGHGSLLR